MLTAPTDTVLKAMEDLQKDARWILIVDWLKANREALRNDLEQSDDERKRGASLALKDFTKRADAAAANLEARMKAREMKGFVP